MAALSAPTAHALQMLQQAQFNNAMNEYQNSYNAQMAHYQPFMPPTYLPYSPTGGTSASVTQVACDHKDCGWPELSWLKKRVDEMCWKG